MSNTETQETRPLADPAAESPPPATAPAGPTPKPKRTGSPDWTERSAPPGGALFRALVNAGADAVVAYTATDETASMISASVTAQIEPMFVGIQEKLREHDRILEEHSRILDEHTRILDEHSRKLDEHTRILTDHTRILAEHGRMLASLDARLSALEAEVRALRELFEASFDALRDMLRVQFRLVWGALGGLVTILIAVFGFLFTK